MKSGYYPFRYVHRRLDNVDIFAVRLSIYFLAERITMRITTEPENRSRDPRFLVLVPKWQYFFDVWGEYLIFHCNSDGKIYYNTGGVGFISTQIPNSPTHCSAIITTDERFVVAFGAGSDVTGASYNRISWCDREDFTVWTATAINMAGGLNVTTASPILDVAKWGNVIVFTSTAAYIIKYVGAPFVYGCVKISDCSVPISPRATVATPKGLVWIGEGGVMLYNGTISDVPCPVWDSFRENISRRVTGSVCGGHNLYNSEVWWFWPSEGNYTPTMGMIWNYKENLWSLVHIGRSSWVDAGTWKYPIAATSDGHIVQHEATNLALSYGIGGSAPYLESAPMDVAYGDKVIFVDALIPDETTVNPDLLSYTLDGQLYPGTPATSYGPYSMLNGKIDCRATARQFKISIVGPTDKSFGVGVLRANVTSRGKR